MQHSQTSLDGKDGRKQLAWFVGMATIAFVVGLIMIPPILGVADSGDFSRVLGGAGLTHLDPQESYASRYFGYTHQYFGYGGYSFGGYFSTHVILVAIAGWIGRLWNGQLFDIRILGVCYTLLFAGAITLLIRYSPRFDRGWMQLAYSLLFAMLLLFVFADVGYTAYFQSFFGEPFAFIAILLAVASALAIASSEEPSRALFLLFIVAVLALATSKIQNAPIGFAFALLTWRMMALYADRRWRRFVTIGIVIIVIGSSLMMIIAPDRLKHVNLYQSIFYGVLKGSDNVEADMKELGIPLKYKVLAGTNYFQKDTVIPQNDPLLHREVLEQLSHKDIAFYYVSHPARGLQKLKAAAGQAFHIRPGYLGNYDRSAGKPSGAMTSQFNLWSEWKARHMPHTLFVISGFYLLYYLLLMHIWVRSESRKIRFGLETLMIVGISGAFAFAVPLIGDGEADLAKHLFMFNVCFDMMLVSVVMGIAYAIGKRIISRSGRVSKGV
ncbi:MAG: hypothetical protein P0Y55_17175 [Candidatus Cohnella colombiensis]|uniref:Uncharacterized protein n=1 Tax=Candidatus Cohnella colombiensis TaxID=3121368 RepID=A0AA95EWI2_9BACL|nr:MAG: hypothetical protein P0Y55_17175 [Cohnella sp.]